MSCGSRDTDWILGRNPARIPKRKKKVTEVTPGYKNAVRVRSK